MKTIIWFIISLFFIIACKNTNLTIVKNSKMDMRNDTISYSTYWTAMRCGLPSLAPKYNPEKDELKFAEGLTALIEGQIEKSESKFKKLFLESNNDTVRENSKIILSQLLIYQSKWKSYYDLLRDESKPDSSEIKRLLYPSFIGLKTYREFTSHADTIPIKLYKGLVLVPVSINEKIYYFLFDTGVQLTTLSSDIIKESGCQVLNLHGKALIGSTGKSSDGHTSVIKKFNFGNYYISNLPCFITDASNLELRFLFIPYMKFDGIIGWDIIKNIDVEIDYKNKIMIIREPIERDNEHKNLFWLNDPVVKLKSIGGANLLFFLDLGAQESCFYDFLLQKLILKDLDNSYTIDFGLGGSILQNTQNISKINFIFDDYYLCFNNLKKGISKPGKFFVLDGSLGNDIGQNNILRIDASNNILEIKKNSQNP
jgi:hypothetical protein